MSVTRSLARALRARPLKIALPSLEVSRIQLSKCLERAPTGNKTLISKQIAHGRLCDDAIDGRTKPAHDFHRRGRDNAPSLGGSGIALIHGKQRHAYSEMPEE